jgi:UDP-glucuronate 4-epimerase
MSTYLVTGTAGFIGSKVAELLLRDGHAVLGVDNLGAADARLKRWRLDQLARWPGFTLRCADIADRAAMSALFETDVASTRDRPSAVINLAARAGVRYSATDPWAYVDTNVTGTLNLLEMCRQFDIGKFVLASTSSLYGASCRRPFQEDAETDRPLSPYAASKKAAEAMAYTYHYLHGLDVTVLRYFTVTVRPVGPT